MTDCTRPVLRWHGGKWLLAPWIIQHLPPHRTYVEPFAGAASVLLRKSISYAEIYNDLDQDVVNLFQVLRSDRSEELVNLLRLTPFARQEFNDAYFPTNGPVERARRLIIRSFQGFGSNAHNIKFKSGFRANSNRNGTTPAHDWANFPDPLNAIIQRLQSVVIESQPAIACMRRHDSAETLHYVDPPYLPETRSASSQSSMRLCKVYNHELTVADHAEMLAFLGTLTGMVVLSGYPSTMYDKALRGWHRIERKALADGARERTEVLWINPAAWRILDREPEPHQVGMDL